MVGMCREGFAPVVPGTRGRGALCRGNSLTPAVGCFGCSSVRFARHRRMQQGRSGAWRLSSATGRCACFGCLSRLLWFRLDKGCPPAHPQTHSTAWDHCYFMPFHVPGLLVVLCISILNASIKTN